MNALREVQQARIVRGRRLLADSDRADAIAQRAAHRLGTLKASGMSAECPKLKAELLAAWWARTALARRLHVAAVAVLNGGAL